MALAYETVNGSSGRGSSRSDGIDAGRALVIALYCCMTFRLLTIKRQPGQPSWPLVPMLPIAANSGTFRQVLSGPSSKADW